MNCIIQGGEHMLIANAIEKMVDFYEGNIHDIDHFIKVWALEKM